MALNTVGDLITEVLVRNNRSTTDSFITDVMLQGWAKQAHTWATAFHKWPFSEGRIATTFTTGTGDGSDEWNFEGVKSDSIRFIVIGGKRLQKINFEDYQMFRQESTNSQDRVYSDFGRIVFVNPNVDASGTMTAYLQFQPTLDVTDLTATTLFSNFDEEGNEALVQKMSSYLKFRENQFGLLRGKLAGEAFALDEMSVETLERVWKRIEDEQAIYQTKDRNIWKRFDVLRGGLSDELTRRDRWF